MKIIRRGYEKEVICPKCKALLYYVTKDIHLVGDMEGDYNYCVKCPVCGKEIKITMTKVRDFFSVFSRKQVEEIDKRIEKAQKEENARLQKKWYKAKDFPMNK